MYVLLRTQKTCSADYINKRPFFCVCAQWGLACFQLVIQSVPALILHVICYKSSPHLLKVTGTANQCAEYYTIQTGEKSLRFNIRILVKRFLPSTHSPTFIVVLTWKRAIIIGRFLPAAAAATAFSGWKRTFFILGPSENGSSGGRLPLRVLQIS